MIRLFFILIVSSLISSANDQKVIKIWNEDGSLRRIGNPKGEEPHVKVPFKKGGAWKLWYIVMATRSEGIHGELFDHKKNRINGKKIGEKKTIQGSVYVWHGAFSERKNLFDQSGWIPEKSDEYVPSKKLIAKASKKPENGK